MAITLRSTKGTALTHAEMDTNLTSYYVSSSLNGSTLKLFTHGTGSYSATTHSVDLSGFLDDTNLVTSVNGQTGTVTVTFATGSFYTSSSLASNTITFFQGDGTTESIDLSSFLDDTNLVTSVNGQTGAVTITPVNTGSFYYSSSLASNTLTFYQGDGTTEAIDLSSFLDDTNLVTSVNGQTGDITIEAGNTGSFYKSSSLAASTLTFYQGDGTTESVDLSSFLDDTNLVTSVNSQTGDITIAEDQTVTLEGQNIEVNGSYPNFQITGSDQSTDVTIAAGRDYITISGQELTLGAIDLTTDVTGILPAANIAAIALTTVQTAADETAMLALTTQEGDVVVRTDENKTYMHNGGTAGDMTDFTELATPQSYTHPTLTPTDTTSSATPAHGGTFTAIDSITVNGTGHVSAINTKTVTLPADNDTTYDVFDDSTDGLVPTPGEIGTTKFLRQDGTWVVPTDTDTVYTHPSITATENTSTASPAHGGTFTAVDSVTVNSEGHVTAYNLKTVTLPADNNTTYSAGDGLGLTGTIFSLDTPSTLSVSSTNGVTADSHTHAITTTTNGTASTIVATDANSEVTAANFITTSDRRLKSEIEPIKDGLDVVRDIIAFEYIKNGQKEAGFIAQDVQEVLPYAVREGEDGYLKMTDRAILAHLHKAVQQLDERLSAIEEKLG